MATTGGLVTLLMYVYNRQKDSALGVTGFEVFSNIFRSAVTYHNPNVSETEAEIKLLKAYVSRDADTKEKYAFLGEMERLKRLRFGLAAFVLCGFAVNQVWAFDLNYTFTLAYLYLVLEE